MSYKSARQLLIGVIVAFLLFSLATCFSGCLTARNLAKHNDKFPDSAANYAARKYPRRDSIGEARLDSIKQADNTDYSSLIDSLNTVVDSLNSEWAADIDSATSQIAGSMYKKLSDAKREIVGLKEVIAKLRREYKPCEPEIQYFTAPHWEVDGPAIVAANLRTDSEKKDKLKAIDELNRVSAGRDEWKQKARIRFWIMTSLILLIIVLVGIRLVRMFNKIPLPNNP